MEYCQLQYSSSNQSTCLCQKNHNLMSPVASNSYVKSAEIFVYADIEYYTFSENYEEIDPIPTEPSV